MLVELWHLNVLTSIKIYILCKIEICCDVVTLLIGVFFDVVAVGLPQTSKDGHQKC